MNKREFRKDFLAKRKQLLTILKGLYSRQGVINKEIELVEGQLQSLDTYLLKHYEDEIKC